MKASRPLCLFWYVLIVTGGAGGCGSQRSMDLHHHSTAESIPVGRYLVPMGDQILADRIAASFDAEGIKDGAMVVYATPTQGQLLRQIAPRAWLDTPDIQAEIAAELDLREEGTPELYNYPKVQQRLQELAENHPDIAEVIQYGTSTAGRNLAAIRVTAPGKSENRSAVMITGATHGNEILTVDVVMALIEESIDGYAANARFRTMLESKILYFVPIVSPDSYVVNSREVDGVDPNRQYPWPDNPNRNPTRVIDAIMDFSATLALAGSIDFHSTAAMIMYPWAWTRDYPADRAKYETVTRDMAAANRYQAGQISRILYVAQGSSADYYYWKYGSISLGIELSQGSPSGVNQVIQENRESTWRFVEAM